MRRSRSIPEGKQGCLQKIRLWLSDEGVEPAVREHLSGAGESKHPPPAASQYPPPPILPNYTSS